MTYDWLSRKTAMTDPDMGSWSYSYDNNGNLISQTDAKSQTITFTYDALNRLTGKSYPQSSGMTDVTYSYDSTDDGNYGKGLRTGMIDALGTTSYKYDYRGRLTEEKRTVDTVDYTTQFAYNGLDQVTTITYPTGEVVTDGYNGRGLPYSLSGTTAGSLVTSTLYNQFGQITEINLGNGLQSIFGYWDVGGNYDTTGGYYGRLWRITTGDDPVLQDVKHTWDAGGNLSQREDVLAEETESFTYDFLDRLTAVSGHYSHSYAYDEIGNITSMNGSSYTYSTKPHAVTAVGQTSYTYDANGNMTARGSQTITWDVENRPVSITEGQNTSTFVYDGDGSRGKKTEGGETLLYINQYYEKNLDTGEVTTYYYLGGRLVAKRTGTTLNYIHQDHLTGTALMTDISGDSAGTIKYYPYGSTRSGSVSTDKKFTGQRLDDTGLYYYNARYYDPEIGKFISADIVVPDPMSPQAYNRYSYCLNNPLKYTDPSGRKVLVGGYDVRDIHNWGYWELFYSSGFFNEEFQLLNAWWALMAVDPDLTSRLAESPDKTVILEFGNIDAAGQCLPTDTSRALGHAWFGTGDRIDWTITLHTKYQSGSLSKTAAILGHELIHADDPLLSDSVQEELRAFQFEDRVRHRFSGSYKRQYQGTLLVDLDPSSADDLQVAYDYMNQDYMPPWYSGLPLYPAPSYLDFAMSAWEYYLYWLERSR